MPAQTKYLSGAHPASCSVDFKGLFCWG